HMRPCHSPHLLLPQTERTAGSLPPSTPHHYPEGTDPDQVLRREHPVEGNERGHGRRRCDQERLAVPAASPRKEDPDRQDGGELEGGREIGCEAGAVSA